MVQRMKALDELISVLTPEPLGHGVFRGRGSWDDGGETTYGGHFLGQATAAALASVDDDRHLHSVHAYFLAPGKPHQSIDYTVNTVRDGRTFCTRKVSAQQEGRLLFELMASFKLPEEGPAMEPEPPSDFQQLPNPETLPTYYDLMSSLDPCPMPLTWALRDHGVDVRTVNAPWVPAGVSAAGGIRIWIRSKGEMPDDPKLHTAMLAYQSDESLADNVAICFDVSWGSPDVIFVSLDHAMWWHRPFRLDEWLFVEQWPVTVSNARGLASGRVWNTSGQLVASFNQEALIRF